MPVFYEDGTPLFRRLAIPKGVTAFVGGGGKTTLMLRLARELAACGRVLVTTTTHIWPPEGMPVLLDPDDGAVRAALEAANPVCVGVREETGKLTPCRVAMTRLCELADYVLVEADGARGMPLKAPAAHEPVIPENAALVVAVAGLSGVGKPIVKTVFRGALYAALLGCDEAHIVTPEDVARVLSGECGQYKGVPVGARFAVVLNQADGQAQLADAARIAALLPANRVERVAITSRPGWNKERAEC